MKSGGLKFEFKKYVIIIIALSAVYFWSWYRLHQMLKGQSTVPYKEITQEYLANASVGCVFPKVDPFSKFALKYNVDLPEIVCNGYDWVQCNMSQCGLRQTILNSFRDIVCYYKDIIFVNDQKYTLSEATTRSDDKKYVLNQSDYLKISCTGYEKNGLGLLASRWFGYVAGIRPVTLPSPALLPPSLPSQTLLPSQTRDEGINILIVAFDSTARSGFIRKLPKSYKVLTEEMGAVVLEGYNVVGDGTKDALFPILTGKTDMQHLGRHPKDVPIDPSTFIFQKAKKYGYHTAYYEDMPWIGTFQYRYNGFSKAPADHYLRPLLMAECKNISKWYFGLQRKYCVGDKPTFLLLLDLTRQFIRVRGKRFCFTFISDISHDDFNLISTAEDDLVDFLRHVKHSGYLKDTMVIVMGDHGPRFGPLRETREGRLDERLPFMSIILPERLKRERPDASRILRANAHVLSTPFDIHTTLLDAMGLGQHASDYIVKNSVLKRGLSLLDPIPQSRSCEDADVSPRWCVCLNKKHSSVTPRDPMYKRCVDAVVEFINALTVEKRSLCAKRSLGVVKHVSKLVTDASPTSTAANGFHIDHYELLIILTPGQASFDISLQFDRQKDRFIISDKDISRISVNGLESSCVSATHPHLAKYCYCDIEHRRNNVFDWLTF